MLKEIENLKKSIPELKKLTDAEIENLIKIVETAHDQVMSEKK